jgi:hypothetical protein
MPSKPPVKRGLTKRGAPTKRNDEVIEHMLRVARTGLPTKFIATAGGITRETLSEWRAADPALNRKIEEARMEGVERRWQLVAKAAEAAQPNSWQAAAWMLERAHPDAFSTPAVQFGVAIQNNAQTNVNNTLVITAEQAEGLQKRVKTIDAEVDELMKAHEAKRGLASGTGRDQIREVEATLMSSAAITLPPPTGRHPNWWAMLSRGDATRPITVEAAKYIIETVAVDTLGAQRASGVKVDLDDGALTLRDVWEALESFGGWAALVRRGKS